MALSYKELNPRSEQVESYYFAEINCIITKNHNHHCTLDKEITIKGNSNINYYCKDIGKLIYINKVRENNFFF